jgi:type I restriction enzyme S subunit
MKKGWEIKRLGEVCEVVNGGTPKTGIDEYWDGQHRWITPAEMGKRLSPYVSTTERLISDLGLRNSSARLLPPNSIILSSRAPIGHLVINSEPMATNQGCKGMIPRSLLQYKFLYYYLTSIVDLLNSLGTGATFKELSGGKLKEVTIPIPPLSEQRRIVSILDESFAGLATAKANAEMNLQNARAVFESHLNEVFNKKGEGWMETTIGDQLTLQRGFDITKSQQNKGEVPVVSSGGIKSFHDKAMAKGPGVVIGRKGTLGKVIYLENDYWPHDTTLWVKDFKGNEPRFVYYLFVGLDVKSLDSGAANPALNRNQVHPIEVSWPCVDQQKAIVETLNALQEETRRLTNLYTRKLAALEALKKSLLHQAFSGEL